MGRAAYFASKLNGTVSIVSRDDGISEWKVIRRGCNKSAMRFDALPSPSLSKYNVSLTLTLKTNASILWYFFSTFVWLLFSSFATMRDATECNAAQRIAMHHNAAQCCARYHNAVECRAKQRSTMQQNQHCYSATRCSAMRHNAMKRGGMHDESSVATRCIARTRFMFNGTHDFLTSRHSFSLSLSLSLSVSNLKTWDGNVKPLWLK